MSDLFRFEYLHLTLNEWLNTSVQLLLGEIDNRRYRQKHSKKVKQSELK